MKAFLAAITLIGVGVFVMCFNVIFLKKDFPNSDVGSNENMRRMGIRCMKEDDEELFGKNAKSRDSSCSGIYSEACNSCSLFQTEKHA